MTTNKEENETDRGPRLEITADNSDVKRIDAQAGEAKIGATNKSKVEDISLGGQKPPPKSAASEKFFEELFTAPVKIAVAVIVVVLGALATVYWIPKAFGPAPVAPSASAAHPATPPIGH
jgi:hypothetical protein